jgi:sugar/nucleoside kinase (ribokinase family)
MKYDVYGLGNALVDLQVTVAHAVVESTGHPPGAMVLIDGPTKDRVVEQLDPESFMAHAGGSVANSMVGIVTLGGKTCFTGCIREEDGFGRAYARSLAEAGVDFRPQYCPRATGTCVVLITPDAQRTMLTHLGCAADLNPEGVSEDAVKQSRYVYVEGYLWDGPDAIRACRHAMGLARQHGTAVAFTASDSFCVERHLDDYREIVDEHADLFFANADEAKVLSGLTAPPDAARYLAERCGLAAVTDGPNGAYIASRTEAIHVPAVLTDPVDTTGAGDAFAAGFLHGITHGQSLERAGENGVALASKVIAKYGARPEVD